MPPQHHLLSSHQMFDLTQSMLIWLVLYHHPVASLTSSPVLIGSPDGRKLFPSQISQLNQSQEPSFTAGFLGLVHRITDRGRQFESILWQALMSLTGSKRSSTTAYHPQSNGMVERFHRHLKSALKAQPNPSAWMDALPFVLLGIRTALKADISTTAAEMVYGTTLRLPGEFFSPSSNNTTTCTDPTNYVNQLKNHIQKLHPVPPRTTQGKNSIPAELQRASHVFIRHDAVRKPLQPPYDGPYPVLKHTDKYFVVNINGCKDTVSIHRLKPAHIEPNETPMVTQTIPAHRHLS